MITTETATLAAGCFWGVEALFQEIPGVLKTQVGYTGGQTPNPTYQQVCTGTTGHAEAVELVFDPQVVSYTDIIKRFFQLHDPTTLNRQGPDIGTQYRSAIYYHTEAQKNMAEAVRQSLTGFRQPVVTEISQASIFYPAEEYHQQYFQKKGIAPTCHIKA